MTLKQSLIAVFGTLCLAGLGLGWVVWSSLPTYRGEIRLACLNAPVTVTFDPYAIPTIEASSRLDAYRALGYLHASERLFQMELTRRKMAGRLAEVFGEIALASDFRQRTLGFHRVAPVIAARLPEAHRILCEAYADGVNAYLSRIILPPPEALLLGYRPQPWRCSDTILIVLSMFQELDEIGDQEEMLTVMAQALPQEVTAFLTPDEDPLDTPLLGKSCGHRPIRPVPVTAIAQLLKDTSAADAIDTRPTAASNQWAIASPKGAVFANDMHLPLGVPNLWYRARLRYAGITLDGITLPGAPGLIAGSNGHLAWGFTNAMADVRDLVVLETDPADPGRYRTPQGWEAFQTHTEAVAVKGKPLRHITVYLTRWGPVVYRAWSQRPMAVHWTALDPAAVDLTLLELDRVQTVPEALELFNRAGMPVQNAMAADADGHIGWTLSGRLPRRNGFDGGISLSWADGRRGWQGYYRPSELPRIIDPPQGFLATANHHTVGCDQSLQIGYNFASSYRIQRIHQELRRNPSLNPEQSFALQLDTDAGFYRFYRDLALTSLGGDGSPLAGRIRLALENWNGRADTASTGLPLLDRWRAGLKRAVLNPLLAPCLKLDPKFRYRWLKSEVPLRQLLALRHPYTLPDRRFSDWNASLRAHLLQTAEALEQTYRKPIDTLTWGEVNRADITHPLARGLPWLATWLNLPADPLAGCFECVRAVRPDYGASMRLVAVVARPGAGMLHMPGGQSGHPLSPHYADQHPYWVAGQPLSLAPGSPVSRLRLVPDGE